MVKQFVLIYWVFCSTLSFGQNLSLGLGATTGKSFPSFQEAFNFDVYTRDLIPLLLNADNIEVQRSLSLPIYARFTTKNNWWVQVNYGYETWRLGISGTAFLPDSIIDANISDPLNTAWELYNGDLDSMSFYTAFYDVYFKNEEAQNLYKLSAFERVQYNKLSLAMGGTLNQKGVLKYYYGAGFHLLSTSTFESYQGLVFDTDEVLLQNEVLEAIPKLKSILVAPSLSFGIEKQNLRIGFDLNFHPSPVEFGNIATNNNTILFNDFSTPLLKSISTVSVNLNYTLFNQNFNQQISPEKRAILNPVVIGKYRQKTDLFQFGATVNFPTLHNSGSSVIEDFDFEDENEALNEKLKNENDQYLTGVFLNNEDLNDFIYIQKTDENIAINSAGDIDTTNVFTTLFLHSDDINSIIKTPKISGFIRYNPTEIIGLELNIGYQNQTYGIVAYETEDIYRTDDFISRTRRLLYQENFHEVSLGLNAYVSKSINNISRLGFHVGLNYNNWIPGFFDREAGGINDAELLEDFHDYLIDNDDAEEWNYNENIDGDKGLFTKSDYYDFNYDSESEAAQQIWYHTDFSAYQFDKLRKRHFLEMRFGFDYYIENLKFSVYAERSIARKKSLYNELLSVGMAASLFF